MRVLVVEDDRKIASFLVKGLRQAGFAVDCARDGEAGLGLALEAPYAAAIIDVMLPGQDGLCLVGKLRERKVSFPVLFLSAKRSVEDRVRGLRAGGDDYLTKPFAFTELLARVEALLRRSPSAVQASSLAAGDLRMDLVSREVSRGGRRIELHAREFSLLEYFLRNRGRAVSKAMILENVWNYDFDPQTNVVDVLVCRLREKVDRSFDKKMIETIRGVGYVLKP
ncbi:MAG: response regulator transcription factor [Elusimicrobia bacterium]|nr:response regulator transcription factor [Elusimicrobiota bacterium]MDE2236325.1 response regulator transcription factor [Elusimicrobiota bacterium]MDE2424419.1 response regulator transcription factor [Elusimicrobiota bacterium]